MNGKDKITKMNNMEIKKGDKVRVSKDAPRMYVPVSFWTEGNSVVEEIHEGNAAICYESNYVDFRIVVPIKHLLVNVNGVWKKPKTKPKRTRKVDAEAKEPTAPAIKVGDNVRNIITGEVGRVLDIKRHVAKVGAVCDWKVFYWDLNNIEVFVPKAEECHYIPTEAKKKPNIGSITIPVEVDLTDSYWDAYAADLAKEIALKVANKYNDPKEAADYAVSVAKAVVEGLKRK